MTPEEVDKIIVSAHRQLKDAFLKEMKDKNLDSALKYCFAHFGDHFRSKQYTYHVTVTYEPKLDKNEYWEEDEQGRKYLVSIDKKTGEKSFIISNSYEVTTIYRSQIDFLLKELVVLEPINTEQVEKAIGLNKSFFKVLFSTSKKAMINSNWKTDFMI